MQHLEAHRNGRTRARRYALAGTVLGFGAPAGYLALRWFVGGQAPARHWIARELRALPLTYSYLSAVTCSAMATFGRALGRREDRLLEQEAELARLRGEFAGVVAHDIRDPLQAIALQLEMMAKDASRGGHPLGRLSRVQAALRRLDALVDDLLDSSAIDAQRLELWREPADVATVAGTVAARHREHSNRTVQVSVRGRPPPVYADARRLGRALDKLVDNALKFSPPETSVRVLVRRERRGTSVCVVDAGPGIAREELEKLFDRYHQVRRARTRGSGLGLGLYIAKGIAEAHGGELTCESRIGRGSTFRLWLPRAPADVRRGFEKARGTEAPLH